MLNNLKSLIVVLALSLVAFHFARAVCLQYMSAQTFARRRNAWFALTILAFLSPNFWLFALGEFLVVGWLVRQDENPPALFVFLTFVIPNVNFYIPAPLINQFFPLNQYRILGLAILVPAFAQVLKLQKQKPFNRIGVIDALMMGFVLVQLVVLIPYESVTNTLRRALLLTLDIYLVVFVFQRISSKEKLSEVLVCFWLSTAIMAPVGLFESMKGWLLYTGLGDLWGDPNTFAYLFRGDSLRAQAAAGHSIYLGYQLAAGLGAFLFLWKPETSKIRGWLTVALFSAAMIATGSRGAWLTAVFTVILFLGLRPDATRRLGSVLLVGTVILIGVYLSPLKESVLDRLPIIGHADQDTIEYRQRLLETSWALIKQHPFFGDPFVVSQMESLRQGQGIIDIVNGYVYVALFFGFVGLLFLVGSFAVAIVRGFLTVISTRRRDQEYGMLGVILVSVFGAAIFYIGTGGIITTHYLFLGLLGSYWRIANRSVVTGANISGVPFVRAKLGKI